MVNHDELKEFGGCEICGLKMFAFSKSQAEHNLKLHLDKHKRIEKMRKEKKEKRRIKKCGKSS